MSDTRLEQLSWIDPLADRFERAWKEGRPPSLEEYLQAAPAGQRGALLRELLPVEVCQRRRLGETPTASEYLARLPEQECLIQAVFRADVQTVSVPAGQPEVGSPPTGVWGRYALGRLHGEGGLGQVWLAQDTDLDREVALKTLRPQHAADSTAQRRFLREAQLAGQLEHPNIVPIYELSRQPDGGQLYYTMRFVRGRTMREAIREYHAQRQAGTADPLALPRLLTAFVSVCNALSFAHARGVIHRDLKPDNVMLGGFGETLVLDWGLARKLKAPGSQPSGAAPPVPPDSPPEKTVQGSVLGTPAYMAPEQAQGRIDRIDQRTDVYGLGAILFEVLTGHPPHEGENSTEVMRRICEEPPLRPRSLDTSVPAALDAVCVKAMALEQADRYVSAAELAEDVQRFLADEPVSVYPEGWAQRAGRWARHHRTATAAAVAALAGILLAASVAAVGLARAADQERQARLAAEKSQEQGLRVAARFASRTVSQEVALRWTVLGKASSDPQLPPLVKALQTADRPDERPEWQQLQNWLQRQSAINSKAAGTTSWFLTDAQGRHLGRAPATDRLLTQNFAYRDYFHGGGKDLAPGTTSVRPIRDVHCSIVYESQAAGKPVVAFSAPVWVGERETERGEVIAVLSMTVEVGNFGTLQVNLGEDQVAALVDTRNDWVEGQPRKGLFLHHPRLVELQAERGARPGTAPVSRLDTEKVALFERLRASGWQDERARTKLSWQEQLAAPRRVAPEGLELNYRDPLGGAYGGPWLAAFEPVFVKRPDDSVKDGWVVIVQERRGARTKPR